MTIFLIGYMGTGKTTFGRALARVLGREFIDLDFYVQQRFHRTVTELFAEMGEAGFRRIESGMLREVGEFEDVVIACGGGTPCFGDNLEYMLGRGFTVCLTTERDCLLRRLKAGASKRPLLAGKSESELLETIEKGLQDRAPYYSRAHVIFAGDELENRRQIDDSVEKFINLFKERL